MLGDHALACPRTGLLARRAKVVERAWIRVAREPVGPEGQVIPQQWFAHTTAPNVEPTDGRRLDVIVYGATPTGPAPCCDATLVSPPTRTGQPQPCSAESDGAALRVAERRKRATYPEFAQGGPQRLVVLGTEVGGRWKAPWVWCETLCALVRTEPRRLYGALPCLGGAPVVEHPVRSRAAGSSRHGARLRVASGLARLRSRRPAIGWHTLENVMLRPLGRT